MVCVLAAVIEVMRVGDGVFQIWNTPAETGRDLSLASFRPEAHLVASPLEVHMRKLVVTLALAIGPGAQAQVAQQGADPINRRVDSLVNAALQRPVAAISVAVIKGRDTLLMKGYGMADIENDVAATPQTVFRIGSITKQFTSAAVMQLVEAGTIG